MSDIVMLELRFMRDKMVYTIQQALAAEQENVEAAIDDAVKNFDIAAVIKSEVDKEMPRVIRDSVRAAMMDTDIQDAIKERILSSVTAKTEGSL